MEEGEGSKTAAGVDRLGVGAPAILQRRGGMIARVQETAPGSRRVFRLLLSMALPLLAGALGGWATAGSVTEWYPTLVKPPFNPPPSVFGPVWTTLYLLMGFSLFLVWEKGRHTPGVPRAMAAFGVQLVLNALWSFLFFGARSPGWAMVELVLLWGAILWTFRLFLRAKAVAGWLLAPYLVWVTFAGVLNFSIWTLNR